MRTKRGGGSGLPLRSEAFMRRAMTVFGGSVWRLALGYTHSNEDAEDVYQDVFIRLAQDATAFSGEEHLKAWLLRVTVNRCHDVARVRRRRPSVPLDELAFEPAAPCGVSPEDAHDLWEAVADLPETMRVIVHLYYYEGYSSAEIARLLDLEPSTVRTRMQRARACLKSALGGADNGGCQSVQGDDGRNGASCSSAG